MTTNKNPSKEDALLYGLEPEEYSMIQDHLRRPLTWAELAVFSGLWNEHCSYKSSRPWLKKLHTQGKYVLCGPGENAGVVSIGDNQALVFKIESHNHPSFVEPYHGAATGVGGIMRDIFTMGARPIAMLNALCFGEPKHPKTPHLLEGCVAGIGDYGNCVGIPTVGGQTLFDPCYNGNILVNAMCVGLVNEKDIFYAKAHGIGNLLFYFGAKTGRDGIRGASMASKNFSQNSHNEEKPSVQIANPFSQKCLLEACLELLKTGSVIGLQDMGAAGLTSSCVEMAEKGGVGIALNLDAIPTREKNMQAYEMLLSESQERMLAIIKPGQEEGAKKILEKWGLDGRVVGEIINKQHILAYHQGVCEVDLDLNFLTSPPTCHRPFSRTQKSNTPSETSRRSTANKGENVIDVLTKLLSSPNGCSRRWIFEQYDATVMTNTLLASPSPVSFVQINPKTPHKYAALTLYMNPSHSKKNAHQGGIRAVVTCWRELLATGATPLGLTNCLNFGSPKDPETMGQFVETIEGINEATQALDFPIVSGNVSFYNATEHKAIKPTPVLGGVGLIDRKKYATPLIKKEDDFLLLVQPSRSKIKQETLEDDAMQESFYAHLFEENEDEALQVLNIDEEKKIGHFIQDEIHNHNITTTLPLSRGGVLFSIARLLLASRHIKNLGATVDLPHHRELRWSFNELYGRYLVGCSKDAILSFKHRAAIFGLEANAVATLCRDGFLSSRHGSVNLNTLRSLHDGGLQACLGNPHQ